MSDCTVQVELPDGTKTPKMTVKEFEEVTDKIVADIGHNSGGISGSRLRSFIQRIERLEEDKAAVAEDIKEVYAEAKGTGFDTKIIRQLVRARKIEVEKRREQLELFDLYASAIGMET